MEQACQAAGVDAAAAMAGGTTRTTTNTVQLAEVAIFFATCCKKFGQVGWDPSPESNATEIEQQQQNTTELLWNFFPRGFFSPQPLVTLEY